MPNLPDDETLLPYKNQPIRRFERTINIPGADGSVNQFDECARTTGTFGTKRIAELAPAKDAHWTRHLFHACVVLILIGIGFIAGLLFQ